MENMVMSSRTITGCGKTQTKYICIYLSYAINFGLNYIPTTVASREKNVNGRFGLTLKYKQENYILFVCFASANLNHSFHATRILLGF